MKIAELFVELGIKGSDKTLNTFKGVKSGLGDIKSMSFEAKAAILGAVYALQKMVSTSNQLGTDLVNFNAVTGLSAKRLQEWQYAARQAGVKGEEFTGSLKAVQNNITKMLAGEGAPKGLGLIANAVGIDPKRMQDTFYLMSKFQEFAQKNRSTLATDALKTMGLSENIIAAMRRNVFTNEMFRQAPTYNQKDLSNLDKANVAWLNLGAKIEMAIGKMNAQDGLQIVKDLDKLTTALLDLASALVWLSEKLQVFDTISNIVNGLVAPIKLLKGEDLGKVSKEMKSTNDGRAFGQGTWWMNILDSAFNATLENRDMQSQMFETMKREQLIKGAGASGGSTTVNQNIQFQHDGKDYDKTVQSVNEGTQKAFRTSKALKGGY